MESLVLLLAAVGSFLLVVPQYVRAYPAFDGRSMLAVPLNRWRHCQTSHTRFYFLRVARVYVFAERHHSGLHFSARAGRRFFFIVFSAGVLILP